MYKTSAFLSLIVTVLSSGSVAAAPPHSTETKLVGVWEQDGWKHGRHRIAFCNDGRAFVLDSATLARNRFRYLLDEETSKQFVTLYDTRRKQRLWRAELKLDGNELSLAQGPRTYFYERSTQPSPCDDNRPLLSLPYQLNATHWVAENKAEVNLDRPFGQRAAKGAKATSEELGLNLSFDGEWSYAGYAGHKLRVTNYSAELVSFVTMAGYLPIVHEALAPDGSWQAIESLPSSFCGNAYYELSLRGGDSWELILPAYEGPYRTQLRIRASTVNGPVYSEPFDGSIHLAQLDSENKQSYLAFKRDK